MKAKEFFRQKLGPAMDNLAARWLDEHEYEDWTDYETVIIKLFEKHPEFVLGTITKRPFQVMFAGENKKWVVRMSRNQEEVFLVEV